MSVAVRRAIYGKLAGDTTLNNLLAAPPTGYSKSIWYQAVPSGAQFPYVVINKQAGTPTYALGSLAMDADVWLVKGVDRTGAGGNPGSADTVDAIASRLDALLTDASLSISGKTHLYLRRESDVDYSEDGDGTVYRHAGALFRLVYA